MNIKIKFRGPESLLGYCCVLFLSLSPARAAGPGTGAADFLKIPVGARETSLGGAFTAVADNANAVYYNPAGLSMLRNPEISFTQNQFVEGISQQWLSAAYPYKTGAFGFGLNYLSVPAFDAYDSGDNPTGSVSASDMAAYLSWGGRLPLGYKFLRSLSYGASVKYISEKLDTEKGAGYGLDLGFLAASAVENLRFGLGVENVVSSKIKFIEEGANPAVKFKTGVVYKIRSLSGPAAQLSLDYIFWTDRPGYVAAGIDNLFNDVFSVRIGYSAFGDISNGLNFGLGFNLAEYIGRPVAVDYAYGSTYALGSIHKLSVTYKFGAPRPAPVLPVPPETAPAAKAETAPIPAVSTVTVISAPEKNLAYYTDLLKNGDTAQRLGAIPELVARGGRESLTLLLGLLKDGDPGVITEAVGALAGFNDPRVIEPFIRLFKIKNVNIRLAAVSGLASFKDERVLAALRERLADRSPRVRRRAAAVLKDLGVSGAAAVPPEAAEENEVTKAQSAVQDALEKLDSGAAEETR